MYNPVKFQTSRVLKIASLLAHGTKAAKAGGIGKLSEYGGKGIGKIGTFHIFYFPIFLVVPASQ